MEEKYNNVNKVFNNFTNLCIKIDKKKNKYIYDTKKNIPIIKLEKLLGTPEKSKDGESYESVVLDKKKSINNIAVKITPYRNKSKTEIEILEIVTKGVLKNETQNFNILYRSFICNYADNFKFESTHIDNKINQLNEMSELSNELNKVEKKMETYKPKMFNVFKTAYDSLKVIIEENNKLIQKKIIKYKGFTEEALIIVNELADMDLHDYLKQEKIQDLEGIFKQIAYGCDYMRKNNIIHFDLHVGNILLKKQKNAVIKYKNNEIKSDYIVKITDFGRSIILTDKTRNTVYKKMWKEMTRFYPNYYIKDDEKVKENFIKNIKKLGDDILYAFDLWRIYKNITSLTKNTNILITGIISDIELSLLKLKENIIDKFNYEKEIKNIFEKDLNK